MRHHDQLLPRDIKTPSVELPQPPNTLPSSEKTFRLICSRGWFLPRMQSAPFFQQLLFGLTVLWVWHAGACRAYLGAVRRFVGANTLSAPVGINDMCSANGPVRASGSAISTQPGNGSAFLSNYLVSYLVSLPSISPRP